MKKLALMLTGLLLALAVSGCPSSPDRWKIVDTPWCAADKGMGSFDKALGVLVRDNTGAKAFILDGSGPNSVTLFDDRALVAVVTCPQGTAQPPAELVESFGEQSVPVLCNGQQILVQPTWSDASGVAAQAYAGVFRFPELPANSVSCARGKLATNVADPDTQNVHGGQVSVYKKKKDHGEGHGGEAKGGHH